MSLSVRQEGVIARKSMQPLGLHHGKNTARNTATLIKAGFTTAPARLDERTSELIMPWLSGINGRQWLIRQLKKHHQTKQHRLIVQIYDRTTTPLIPLHHCPVDKLILQPFDCWRKILNRINNAAPPLIDAETARASHIQRSLAALEPRIKHTPPLVPIHGDFHSGQLIISDQHQVT